MDRSTYPDHQDLLAQVATSEEEEREVRRVLGDHAHRHSRPACSRCESGLTRCVTPAACERADDPRPPPERGDLYRVLAMATWPLYAVALGAFFAWLML